MDEFLLPPMKKSSQKGKTVKNDVPKLNPITASDFFGGTKISHKKKDVSKKPQFEEQERHNIEGFTDVLKSAQGDLVRRFLCKFLSSKILGPIF